MKYVLLVFHDSFKDMSACLRGNFTGSRFELHSGDELVTEIQYQSRITTSTDELGPCRRFSVKAFTQPLDPILKERRFSEVTCDDAIIEFRSSQSVFFHSVDPSLNLDGRYVLNFGEAETVIASVKNFILHDIHARPVLMMFKVEKNKYCIKLNCEMIDPLVCFGICLSSIDHKLCTQ